MLFSSLGSNFRDVGNVISVVFGEIKMSFWVRKRQASNFGKATAAHKFGR